MAMIAEVIVEKVRFGWDFFCGLIHEMAEKIQQP
jgi:hypothetical protein